MENKPKPSCNNISYNRPSAELKTKETKYKNNLENYSEENKHQEIINKALLNQITKSPNLKNELRNEICAVNGLNNLKRKENDRKDMIDISDFIKNKKHDKK